MSLFSCGVGAGAGAAGGAAGGEVVYCPYLNITSGIHNIQIGVDNATPAHRISKITFFTSETISALGGGNSGSQIGGRFLNYKWN